LSGVACTRRKVRFGPSRRDAVCSWRSFESCLQLRAVLTRNVSISGGLRNEPAAINVLEVAMYHHVKKLMYTVRVDQPDPRFGNMLLEQFGGANGELAAAMQ
jgi:hypothetical protein